MNKNEFDDVKELIDNLIVNSAINTIKIKVLTSMVLGVYKETLPEKNSILIAKNYCDALEKELMDSLSVLQDGLFDESGTFLIRQMTQIPGMIQKLRLQYC